MSEETTQDRSPYEYIKELVDKAEGMNDEADIFAVFRFPDEHEGEEVSSYNILAMCSNDTAMNVSQMALTIVGRSLIEEQGLTVDDFETSDKFDTAAFAAGLKLLAQRGAVWAQELQMHAAAQEAKDVEGEPSPEPEKQEPQHYSDTVVDEAGVGAERRQTHKGDGNIH